MNWNTDWNGGLQTVEQNGDSIEELETCGAHHSTTQNSTALHSTSHHSTPTNTISPCNTGGPAVDLDPPPADEPASDSNPPPAQEVHYEEPGHSKVSQSLWH